MSLLLNKMTRPNDNTFYVTLTSQKTEEFANNSPTQFQYRLPQSLWLPGKWKVGVANIYLQNPPNDIPHVVTSHVQKKVTEPITDFSLEKLYFGSTTDIMFQLYSRAFKADNVTKSSDLISTIKKQQLPLLKTGVLFFEAVYQKLQQDLLDKLPAGYRFSDGTNRWIPEFSLQESNSFQLRHYQIDPKKRKTQPYFAINLKLAESMGWVIPLTQSTYELGPNLLLQLPDGWNATKLDPADCGNDQFSFSKPIHVTAGLLYLCAAFTWRFIHLDTAFTKGTTHFYKPPLVAQNVFEYIMKAENQWSLDHGVSEARFTELSISPHDWNRKVMSFDLVKDDTEDAYDSQFSWSIWRLNKNQNYTICIELYQTDKWLFDHATVSLTVSSGITLNHVKITKHTHEYHGQHMLYYHKLEGQVNRWRSQPPAYVYLNYKVEHVTNWYAKILKRFMYAVVYGVKGWVNDVPDVFDGHPILPSPRSTKKTQSITPAAKKESTVHPVHHGDVPSTMVYLYSNLTKSIFGVNDIFKSFDYKHQTGLIDFNPIQFHPLRNSFLDVLDFELKPWNNGLLSFNKHVPTIVTLLFKKKLTESQRKYIKLEESVDHDVMI